MSVHKYYLLSPLRHRGAAVVDRIGPHTCSLNLLDEGGRCLGTRYLDY